ncbi:MAG: LytS/YhcK type 5TM receptor domain-containing protein [Planktotalea sp.]|uniref:LytS/YhcK type 5TM receptor domain-containing protein n=1 Tax=Planktotalea sp. TaxID=2029877 RepID=UPI003C77BDD0
MLYSTTMWLDLTSALAVLSALTIAYGHLRGSFLSDQKAQMCLGAAFGAVAWMQMHMPIEPIAGLIIDLRNIPLVLCGAFLGWRAGLLCLSIGIATRYQIGGIGMYSGMLAMSIALCAGLFWARLTRHIRGRSIWQMLGLALVGSLHLSALVVLPEPAKTWFISNAVFPIFLLNLFAIPIVALLLDAEKRNQFQHLRLKASVALDPDTGALTGPVFEREVALRVGSGAMSPPAALLVIEIKHHAFLRALVPVQWQAKLLGLVRVRIQGAIENADVVCSLGLSRLVIPLSVDQLLGAGRIQQDIERLVHAEPFIFLNQQPNQVAVETQVVPWAIGQSVEGALHRLPSKRSRKRALRRCGLEKELIDGLILSEPKTPKTSVSEPAKHSTSALFGKAALLMGPGSR